MGWTSRSAIGLERRRRIDGRRAPRGPEARGEAGGAEDDHHGAVDERIAGPHVEQQTFDESSSDRGERRADQQTGDDERAA